MALADIWNLSVINQSPGNMVLAVFVLMLICYVARWPLHKFIFTLTYGLRRILKLISNSLLQLENQLRQRNKDVLLAYGRELAEKYLERDFQRIAYLVNRDLSGYPALQSDLKSQIEKMEDDYSRSAEEPPQPPEWLRAIEAVAEVPSNGSAVVAKILSDIHKTLKKALDKNVVEYRKANRLRHGLLGKMMPYWRSMANILGSFEKNIAKIEARASITDKHMELYETILAESDEIERVLSVSSIKKLIISSLLLGFSLLAGHVCFQLLAMPMTEIVGVGYSFGTVKSSELAAMFVLVAEVMCGAFLMDAIGITRIFPAIGALESKRKNIVAWMSFVFVLVLALAGASLAYIHDVLIMDKDLLMQLLSDDEIILPELKWVPLIGNMVLGFILPFMLMFVVIPLEMFVSALRSIAGVWLVWILMAFRQLVVMLEKFIGFVGRLVISVYDLFICLPLKLENVFSNKKTKDNKTHVESEE